VIFNYRYVIDVNFAFEIMDEHITVTDAGFEMSATIEAKTKGIWIWCVPHPKVKGRCLALMDTEGLGDPMKVSHELTYNESA